MQTRRNKKNVRPTAGSGGRKSKSNLVARKSCNRVNTRKRANWRIFGGTNQYVTQENIKSVLIPGNFIYS